MGMNEAIKFHKVLLRQRLNSKTVFMKPSLNNAKQRRIHKKCFFFTLFKDDFTKIVFEMLVIFTIIPLHAQ